MNNKKVVVVRVSGINDLCVSVSGGGDGEAARGERVVHALGPAAARAALVPHGVQAVPRQPGALHPRRRRRHGPRPGAPQVLTDDPLYDSTLSYTLLFTRYFEGSVRFIGVTKFSLGLNLKRSLQIHVPHLFEMYVYVPSAWNTIV